MLSSISKRYTISCLLLLYLRITDGYVLSPQQQTSLQQHKSVLLPLQGVVNGASDGETDAASATSSSSGKLHNIIPLAATGKSQLVSAFSALDETDQYDAVLTGLCAKMLDAKMLEDGEEQTDMSLEDPIQLLQEMNGRNIEASPRSIMALIDATVKTQDEKSMAQVLSLCSRNRAGITQYGILQQSIIPLPSTQIQQPAGLPFAARSAPTVLCPDGTRKTRQERLDSVPDIPQDDRSTEVASALAVTALFGIGGITDVFGMDDIAPLVNTLLFVITIVGVVDNFYDVLTWGTKVAGSVIAGKEKEQKSPTNIGDNLKLPEKDSLPFGLGQGKVTGTVVRGFSRLVSVDTERECECEAAALYVGYTLGLPCFAFRPNSLEAACLIADSIQQDNKKVLDPLLSNFGILKVLTWLLAPVAMESMKHTQLINSDPREAEGFLQRLIERRFDFQKSLASDDISWLFDDNIIDLDWKDKEKEDLIKWAYTEADVLLRNNMDDITKVSQQLSSGAATIGDCVATIEKW